MPKTLNIEFEKAVRFLSELMPVSDETTRKPVLFHDIRVGVYLYENNYSREVVLAGLLHDIFENTSVAEEFLAGEFGLEVVRLVKASTKDESIQKEGRNEELVRRCVNSGQDALIVKAADILDSFKYYTRVNNHDQLKNHCMKNADLIFKYKPSNFADAIFVELRYWLDRSSLV